MEAFENYRSLLCSFFLSSFLKHSDQYYCCLVLLGVVPDPRLLVSDTGTSLICSRTWDPNPALNEAPIWVVAEFGKRFPWHYLDDLSSKSLRQILIPDIPWHVNTTS